MCRCRCSRCVILPCSLCNRDSYSLLQLATALYTYCSHWSRSLHSFLPLDNHTHSFYSSITSTDCAMGSADAAPNHLCEQKTTLKLASLHVPNMMRSTTSCSPGHRTSSSMLHTSRTHTHICRPDTWTSILHTASLSHSLFHALPWTKLRWTGNCPCAYIS